MKADSKVRLVAGMAALVAGFAATAQASVIVSGDRAAFEAIPHTLIDFESTGAGVPLGLIPGQSQAMSATEYLALGITFSPQVNWVNDGSSAFQGALLVGGSQETAIPSAGVNDFTVLFSIPVRAFGFFVVNNRAATITPSFVVRDAAGGVMATQAFTGNLIDGSISNANTTADYGWVGFISDTPMASVSFSKEAAIFDDFIISTVPTPGALALLGFGGVAMLRRRR